MNKQRRGNIAKAKDLLDQALYILETAQEEEQDFIDNMPANLAASERAEKAEQAANDLKKSVGKINNILDIIFGIE